MPIMLKYAVSLHSSIFCCFYHAYDIFFAKPCQKDVNLNELPGVIKSVEFFQRESFFFLSHAIFLFFFIFSLFLGVKQKKSLISFIFFKFCFFLSLPWLLAKIFIVEEKSNKTAVYKKENMSFIYLWWWSLSYNFFIFIFCWKPEKYFTIIQ